MIVYHYFKFKTSKNQLNSNVQLMSPSSNCMITAKHLASASTAWPEDQPSTHPRETSEDEQEATARTGGTA